MENEYENEYEKRISDWGGHGDVTFDLREEQNNMMRMLVYLGRRILVERV